MRLILCIDRDNDFGEKAGVESPVIGRRKNLSAAQKLIMTDPEDSDANTLFAAIREYDILRSQGESVAIALLCGSRNVGRESDDRVREQLDSLLARLKPTSVILFDDGAEDEALSPVIESRVRVDRKVRVIVQQNVRIESFYYMLKNVLMKDRARKKVMIPLAMACITWAVAAFAGRPEIGTGAIVFLIGLTLLIWAFHLENLVITMGKDMRNAVHSGAISIYLYLFALVVLVIGIVNGYALSNGIDVVDYRAMEFVRTSHWYYIGAIWLVLFGRALDNYLRQDRRDHTLWPLSMALFSAGFLLNGAIGLAEFTLGYRRSNLLEVFWSIVIAAFIVGVGIVGHSYIKEHTSQILPSEDWRF
ncbi:MAG: DUF373 family protein [Thermoplasmata archaeon]|nr:DUF373 family protein [Thermoplasmata archaeon]